MKGAPGMAGGGILTPRDILELGPEEADSLLDRLEAEVPVGPGLLDIPSDLAGELLVLGDTHGDWPSTVAGTAAALSEPGAPALIGLGDYVDRPPADCPDGSVANALYLLGLRAAYPDRVFLLKGNHEAARRIPVVPHGLPEEVDDLWGPDPERYYRLMGLLERGSWAARTESGVYLAHAGFPLRASEGSWRSQYETPTEATICDIVWRDASASRLDRRLSPPFGQRELDRFLASSHSTCFLRGHDPDLTGQLLYGGRCLTVHTTRVFERYGGVLLAHVALDRPVGSAQEIRVEHLPTEGMSFPID
ncbi:MAG: metallophosphoesterase [Thermoplasmata archaeon]